MTRLRMLWGRIIQHTWCRVFGHDEYLGDGFVAPQKMCKRCPWIGRRVT